MFGPFQVAASIATRVVASETSLAAPPMMPADAGGPSASQTSTASSSNTRCSPSSVDQPLALARAPHVQRRAGERSRSYACIGWPSSSIT